MYSRNEEEKEAMTDYKFSVVYMTYRPGGFDLLAHALSHQTYKNYELIVIDDYPNRNLKKWLEEQGIPVTYYGPMKEKSRKDTTYNQCNVMNTALQYVTGDILVIYNDYSWIHPDSLETWNNYFNNYGLKCIVSACAHEWHASNPSMVGDISVWNPLFNGNFDRFGKRTTWIPTEFELFYSAMPIEYLLDINGFDERADEWCVYWYLSVLAQAKLNDMEVKVDKNHFVEMVNHRTWSIGNSKWWYIVRTGGPPLNNPPRWEKVSPNLFNLKEMRKK